MIDTFILEKTGDKLLEEFECNKINYIEREIIKFNRYIIKIPHDNEILESKITIKTNENNDKVILWIPGFNDTFYHYHITEKIPNYDIFAIDLRRCGSALNNENLHNYIDDITEYFYELDKLLDYIENTKKYKKIILYSHSFGSLISIIYCDYLNKKNKLKLIDKIILNSPFLEFNEPIHIIWLIKNVLYYLNIYVFYYLNKIFGFKFSMLNVMYNFGNLNKYAYTIYNKYHFNPKHKSIKIMKVYIGWLATVVKHQYLIHQYRIKLNKPILLLCCDDNGEQSNLTYDYSTHTDTVLNVNDIIKYSTQLSNQMTICKINNGLHDVLVSYGEINNINTPLGNAFDKFINFLDDK